jgi:hypothetical protein
MTVFVLERSFKTGCGMQATVGRPLVRSCAAVVAVIAVCSEDMYCSIISSCASVVRKATYPPPLSGAGASAGIRPENTRGTHGVRAIRSRRRVHVRSGGPIWWTGPGGAAVGLE